MAKKFCISFLWVKHVDQEQHFGVKKLTWNFTLKYQNMRNDNILLKKVRNVTR